MNRRDFLRTAAATAGTPVLAGAVPSIATSAPLTQTQKLWAAAIAKAQGAASPAYLAKALRTTAEVGEAAFQHLFDTNVVRASGTAINPFDFHVLRGGVSQPVVIKDGIDTAHRELNKLMDDDLTEEEPDNGAPVTDDQATASPTDT